MPHQCTDCRRVFEDGSKEMLSGCPDCGGNKFQFHPGGVDEEPEPESAPEPPDPPEAPVDSTVARTVGTAANKVRDFVGSDPEPPEPPADEPAVTAEPTASSPSPESPGETSAVSAETTATEDSAQASARTDVVSPDELPSTATRGGGSRPTPVLDESADEQHAAPTADAAAEDEADRPDLSELRAELNDQFESIKVLEPGQYELNLMELYDREEYIIALQEDGKYTIQVPERWEEA